MQLIQLIQGVRTAGGAGTLSRGLRIATAIDKSVNSEKAAIATGNARVLPGLVALAGLCLSAQSAAEGAQPTLSFTPDLFSLEVKEDADREPSEARFRSGLGVKLDSSVVQFAVDYRLQSEMSDGDSGADVYQRLGASMYSSALNDMLGLNADIRAGSTIHSGDAYKYSITPGISKSLADLGKFDLRYEYLLDKPSAQAVTQEKSGYSMGLRGATDDGRLSWRGKYRSTALFGGVEQLQSTQRLEFSSDLQLVPELRLELSGHSQDEAHFDGGLIDELYTETLLGAGLSWSPSSQYSVAFKLNSLEESRSENQEVFGSGSVSWFPQPNMEFSLSYGDHLVEGARGVMFNTRINLNDS